MGFVQLSGSEALGPLQVSLILLDEVLLISTLIKFCMRQMERTLSQPLLVQLIRVADGVIYSWENLPEAKMALTKGMEIVE